MFLYAGSIQRAGRRHKRPFPAFPAYGLAAVHPFRACAEWHSLGLALQLRGVPRKGYGLVRLRSLGNSVASFTLKSPRTFCVRRSIPIANPPWGGQPYLKIER